MSGRRDDLDLSQQAVADRASVSLSTVSRVERGIGVDSQKERKIEAAIGWKHGSIDAIREGGEPTLLDEQPTGPGGTPLLARDVDPLEHIRWLRRHLPDAEFFAVIDSMSREERESG